METSSCVVGLVSIDDLTPPVLAQYAPSARWNGWLCPSLDTLGVVLTLEALTQEPNDGTPLAYWFDGDRLFVHDLGEPDHVDDKTPSAG